MRIPSLEEAKSFISEAEENNPGPWVQHSISAARAAEAIAGRLPALEARTAYILAYLHDIGRGMGMTDMRHVLDGYNFLSGKGFEDAARICVTHSFPIKNIHAVEGQWDCSTAELEFIQGYLDHTDYTGYDKLVQLCDALALPSGYCLIEKRFVDVALRHGFKEYTLQRWRAYLHLQVEFEKMVGCSIYDLLPGVVENTFCVSLLPQSCAPF